jgi:hypothetical protein
LHQTEIVIYSEKSIDPPERPKPARPARQIAWSASAFSSRSNLIVPALHPEAHGVANNRRRPERTDYVQAAFVSSIGRSLACRCCRRARVPDALKSDVDRAFRRVASASVEAKIGYRIDTVSRAHGRELTAGGNAIVARTMPRPLQGSPPTCRDGGDTLRKK